MDKPIMTIPELFYDLLSRVIPGCVAITGLLVLLFLTNTISLDTTVLVSLATSINFLLVALALAYIVGSLLGTVSQALDVFFRYGYNPATDYIDIDDTKRRGKKIVFYLEIILGLPFSLFLINEYSPKVSSSDQSNLKNAIEKRFGPAILKSYKNLISCRDYIRVNNRETGNIIMKMTAESAMCRNLVIVFLILLSISIGFSLKSAIFVNMFLLTLAFANYSYRRRYYVQQIYNFFYVIETDGSQKPK